MPQRILIIEDDPLLSEIYVTKFHQEGFTVDAAKDGKEGLSKMKENKPDLILLDVVLPETDGFEVLKSFKKSVLLKDIPVILLTNLSQRNEVEKGIKLGASLYLIKAHFTPTEVVGKVKEILKGFVEKFKP